MGTRTLRNVNLKVELTATLENLLTSSQTASASLGKAFLSAALTSGLGAASANRVWECRDQEIAAGATVDIDLRDFHGIDLGAGEGKDAVGQDMLIEEIVLILIMQSGGDGRLEVMPSRPSGDVDWIPQLTVANGGALSNGGLLLLYTPAVDGFDIEFGTMHVLRLGAKTADVTYDIFVLGKHDDDESSSSTLSTASASSGTTTSAVSSSTQSATTSSKSRTSSSSLSTETTQSHSSSSPSSPSSNTVSSSSST